jgi:hypothetical protein
MMNLNAPDQAKPIAHSVRSPIEIVTALELNSIVDIGGMAARKCAFKAVHMGEQDLPIGTLLDLITSDSALCPPRTGHIGNWNNIALGRAGAMDFNKAICAPGYGYPLLYCFTQTEADTAEQGDWGYLPGSIVEGDVRAPLRLHAWDGTSYAPCSHGRPRFTPFIQAECAGELRPLTEVHAQRLGQIGPHPFKLEQAIFAAHEDVIRPLLHILLDDACKRDQPRRALHDLVCQSVGLDGTLTRCPLELDGKGFKFGDTYYSSTESLVEYIMVPFRAVAKPHQFLAEIGVLPTILPIASNLLTAVLSAALQTHLLDHAASSSRVVGPLNPHLHWGGRDMAGYPPRHGGYLFEDAKLRSLKRMCAALVERSATFTPLCFVMLPATVFMLCPASTSPGDVDLLAKLFRRVNNAAPSRDAGVSAVQQTVEAAVREWHDAEGANLSSYFRYRFGPRRGGLASAVMQPSDPVEPEGFRALTLRQACLVVGALYEVFSPT